VIGWEHVILTNTELVEFFNRPRICAVIVFALQWLLVANHLHTLEFYPCKADTASIADLLLQITMRIGVPLSLILIHATLFVLSALCGRDFLRVHADYPILASSFIPTRSSEPSHKMSGGDIMA
jgi:hypothetical protein